MMEKIKKYYQKYFQNYYELGRDFAADFFKEMGRVAQTHLKALRILLVFCVIAFLVISVGLLRFSESTTFCGLCHQMNAYMESWKTSSHKHVSCTKCHYEPGFLNHLKGKWVDGQVSLAYFISGKRPSRPHAEISDASCLQKGCHQD